MNLIICEMEMINSLCLYYIMSAINYLDNINVEEMMKILIEIRRDLANTTAHVNGISRLQEITYENAIKSDIRQEDINKELKVVVEKTLEKG